VYRYHVDATLSLSLSFEDFETVSARRFLSCAFALFPESYARSGLSFSSTRASASVSREYKRDKTFIA